MIDDSDVEWKPSKEAPTGEWTPEEKEQLKMNLED